MHTLPVSSGGIAFIIEILKTYKGAVLLHNNYGMFYCLNQEKFTNFFKSSFGSSTLMSYGLSSFYEYKGFQLAFM